LIPVQITPESHHQYWLHISIYFLSCILLLLVGCKHHSSPSGRTPAPLAPPSEWSEGDHLPTNTILLTPVPQTGKRSPIQATPLSKPPVKPINDTSNTQGIPRQRALAPPESLPDSPPVPPLQFSREEIKPQAASNSLNTKALAPNRKAAPQPQKPNKEDGLQTIAKTSTTNTLLPSSIRDRTGASTGNAPHVASQNYLTTTEAIIILIGSILSSLFFVILLTLRFGNPQWHKAIYLFQAFFHPGVHPHPPIDFSGFWQQWYRNGQLRMETKYRVGVKHGPYQLRNRSGATIASGLYHEGKPWNGEWAIIDDQSNVVGCMTFREGITQTTSPKPPDQETEQGEELLRNGQRAITNRVRNQKQGSEGETEHAAT